MEPTLSSETSAFKLQTPGKFPKVHRPYPSFLDLLKLAFLKHSPTTSVVGEGAFSTSLYLDHVDYNNPYRTVIVPPTSNTLDKSKLYTDTVTSDLFNAG